MYISGRKDKKQLTLLFLLPEYPSVSQKEIDKHYLTWWHNIRDTGGYRLRDQGYKWLKDILDLEHWSFNLTDQNITYQTILEMDRHIECPYWLNRKATTIVLFGDEPATLLTLYGGDIKSFLDATKPFF
jgi:hypothetical protein